MARTKKKELQKVKAAEAKHNVKTQNRGSIIYSNTKNVNFVSRQLPCNTPDAPDLLDTGVSVKDGIPDGNSSDHSLSPDLQQYSTKKPSDRSENNPESIDFNETALSLNVNGDDRVPIVLVNRSKSAESTPQRLSAPLPRKSASMPSTPCEKISPFKGRKMPASSPSSVLSKSPKDRKVIRRKKPTSPKNIFEKFESETDSQESDSGMSTSTHGSEKSEKHKGKKLNLSFDVSAFPKLTDSKSKASLKKQNCKVDSNSKSSVKSPVKSPVRSKFSPRKSPKTKENMLQNNKRNRSPKLLTDDMILLPLVDHRKPRVSPKKTDKSNTLTSTELQEKDKCEAVSKSPEELNASCMRSLNFPSDSQNELKEESKSKIVPDNEIKGDCSAMATYASMKKLLESVKSSKLKNSSLVDLIHHVRKNIQSPLVPVNIDANLKLCEVDKSVDVESNKEGSNDTSSDETLPAMESPDNEINGGTYSKKEDAISSNDQGSLVATPIETTQREFVRTRLIGDFVIPKPCDDIISVISKQSSLKVRESGFCDDNLENVLELTPCHSLKVSNEEANSCDISSIITSETPKQKSDLDTVENMCMQPEVLSQKTMDSLTCTNKPSQDNTSSSTKACLQPLPNMDKSSSKATMQPKDSTRRLDQFSSMSGSEDMSNMSLSEINEDKSSSDKNSKQCIGSKASIFSIVGIASGDSLSPAKYDRGCAREAVNSLLKVMCSNNERKQTLDLQPCGSMDTCVSLHNDISSLTPETGNHQLKIKLLSPRSKKIHETKEPLPISILCRHEKEQSPSKTSAFYSHELEEYLMDPRNRKAGKDTTSPVFITPDNTPTITSNFEHFEPDFDEIDGALFLSFASEEALKAHINVESKAKWDKDANTFLGISRVLDFQKNEGHDSHDPGNTSGSAVKLKTLRGQHMRWKKYQRLFHKELAAMFYKEEDKPPTLPEKTRDITKIKGWKKKYFNQTPTASKGRKMKRHTVSMADESFTDYDSYCADNVDDAIILNSSGSEIDPDDEDELPMVAEYTEALVPPLPEIPLMSKLARKMFVKKMGYNVEDEVIILKLGGRRVNKLNRLEKDEEEEETPKEKVKKKRIRRRRQDLSMTLTENMASAAVHVLQDNIENSEGHGSCDKEKDILTMKHSDDDVDDEDDDDDDDDEDDDEDILINDEEVVEVQVRSPEDVDTKAFEKDEAAPNNVKDVQQVEEDGKNVESKTTICDKPGCRFSCICHLCNLVRVEEPEPTEQQPTVCEKEYCRLGCICDSLGHTVRTVEEKQPPHCGKAECMIQCLCSNKKTDSASKTKRVSDTNDDPELPPLSLPTPHPPAASTPVNSRELKTKKGSGRGRSCSNKTSISERNSRPNTPVTQEARISPVNNTTPDLDECDSIDGKSKRQKKRTERFSNLPKRESTYRVAKNLDAVNRKAMMVYSVSECYSEQKSRKRKSQVADDNSGGLLTDASPILSKDSNFDKSTPEVVIERDDGYDVDMDLKDYKPVKKRNKRMSDIRKKDDGEMSGILAMQESLEEAGCELRKVLTMDLPLGSSKLHAQIRPAPPVVHSQASPPPLDTKPELSVLNKRKEKIEMMKKQQLLKEQLLKEKQVKSEVTTGEQKNIPVSKPDCRWHTQMVCLKPNPRLGADEKKDVEDEIKLLEFIANCSWDDAKPQILSKVAQCLRPGVYPSTRRMLVGEFFVEILPKADKPPTIPPELKTKLPEVMYSIRVKVTPKTELYQQVMKSQPNIQPKPCLTLLPKPLPTIPYTRPILSIPVVKSKDSPAIPSTTISSTFKTSGGISAFSHLQISQPGQNILSCTPPLMQNHDRKPKTPEIVDLTIDDMEVQPVEADKKKKRKNKDKDTQSGKKKRVKEQANLPVVGPLQMKDLKVVKMSNQNTQMLKLVPSISHNPDLIAVPVQFTPKLHAALTAAKNSGTPVSTLVPPRKTRQPIERNPSPPATPTDFSHSKQTCDGDNRTSNNSSKLCSDYSKESGNSYRFKNTNKFSRTGSLDQQRSEDEDIDVDVLGRELKMRWGEDIMDDDSHLSVCSENSSAQSSHSSSDLLLDEWGKELAEDDENTARDMSKYTKMKRERIRRQELTSLFRNLQSVAFKNELISDGSVQKFKILNQAKNVIEEEQELATSVQEKLWQEEKRNRKLQETILDLIESMWEEGYSQNIISAAVELTDGDRPARPVGKVIDSLEKFSNIRKKQQRKLGGTSRQTCDKLSSVKKETLQSLNTGTNGKSSHIRLSSPKLDPTMPLSESMILATLAEINQRSDHNNSSAVIDHLDSKGDDESDHSVVLIPSSSSPSPTKEEELGEKSPKSNQIPLPFLLPSEDSENSSEQVNDSVNSPGNLEEKCVSDSPKFDEPSFDSSECSNSVKDSPICDDDNIFSINETSKKDAALCKSNCDMLDKEKDSSENVDKEDNNPQTRVAENSTDDKNTGCDLLDLIDRSMPGNLELYEDISQDSPDSKSETNTSKTVCESSSANIDSNSCEPKLACTVAGSTDCSIDNDSEPSLQHSSDASARVCDLVPCFDEKTENEADSQVPVFNFNKNAKSLPILDIDESDASSIIPCSVDHVSNSNNSQGVNMVECSYDVPVLNIQ